MSHAFALFRLPAADHYFDLKAEAAAVLDSLDGLSAERGFLIHPFQASRAPILLLRPTQLNCLPLPTISEEKTCHSSPVTCHLERSDYARSFAEVQTSLQKGECEKVVLARRMEYAATLSDNDLKALFFKACAHYPECFVALFSTPQSGTWLTATPELLLEKEKAANAFRTMALAGTDTAAAANSTALDAPKNRREQQIVSQFIAEALRPIATAYDASPTYIRQTAGLAHLCTDIRFETAAALPQILQRLHPTPAVCGLPRDAALQTILHAEHFDRAYYAGFCGPLGIGERTAFYVTLRCLTRTRNGIALYAGGGILPQSREDDEFEETRRKAEVMLRLF